MEQALAAQNYDLIVGLDEVGRGALAGPVMVGAVGVRSTRLDKLAVTPGVADSKLLSPKKRESIVEALEAWSDAWAVGEASNTEIDEFGIMHALGMAALRGVAKLESALRANDEAAGQLSMCAILDGSFDYVSAVVDSFDAPGSDVSHRRRHHGQSRPAVCKRGIRIRNRQSHQGPCDDVIGEAAAICAIWLGEQQGLWFGVAP
jgi:hypothetical protein